MSEPSKEFTIEFIKHAHASVSDDSGDPYYLHPLAVMNRLPATASLQQKNAALLHDVIEDTRYTREDLSRMGYSDRTLDLVVKVTQKDGQPYLEYVKGIIDSNDVEVIEVKFADMLENMNPERHAKLSPEKREYFVQKYARPIKMLQDKITELRGAAQGR